MTLPTYANGVSSSGHTGVVSLYEKAYAQTFPDGVNNSNGFGTGGVTNGSPHNALFDITGKGTHNVDGQGSWFFGWGEGYDQSERQEIIDSVNSGRPTVASTASSKNFTAGAAPVNVTLPNGQHETIDIYDSHSYTATRADESGGTLINPHGRNPISNTTDSTQNGEFTISWEDFQKYYGDVTIGSLW